MRQLFAIGLFVIGLNAQSQVFNLSIDTSNVAQASWAIEKSDSSFIVFAMSVTTSSNNWGLWNVKIDGNGMKVDSKNFRKYNAFIASGWANTTDATKDGGYIMGGGIDDGVDYGYLVKFDQNGDTVWTRRHGVNGFFDTFAQARQAQDNGYIAVGQSNSRNGQANDGWLVKTDSNGLKEWDKHYGTLNGVEQFSSVYPTTDGGYVMGGVLRDDRNTMNRNYDPIIYKVDSLGNLQWQYWHDTPYDDATAHVIQTFDGNYVFSSGVTTAPGTSSAGIGKAALFKLDTAGNLMWVKTYGSSGLNTGAMVVKQLPDSSLIAAGRIGVLGPKILGYLIHTDKNGDSLFVETYENVSGNNNNYNYLWDVIQLKDKGFMAVGEVWGLPPAVAFRQDAWVIRVDSNGCIMSSCLVGVESLKPKSVNLKLYPNPTNGLVNVESKETIERVEVYNMQGQLVLSLGFERSWETKRTIQVQLPEKKGMYLVQIKTEDGHLYTKKVLIQ